MIFFKNATLYKTTKTSVKNDIGQFIDTYVIGDSIEINLQPIEEKAIKYTWGSDIKASLNFYSTNNFCVDDIVVINNKTYSIEKVIDWVDYKLYAIIESDEKI